MRYRVRKKVSKDYVLYDTFHHIKWRPSYTIQHMKWEINPYDDDDFPSVPHADSIDYHHAYKIDLLDGIGTIYYNRKKYGRLTKKDYNRLMADIQEKGLIRIARKYYREHHPHKYLPVIEAEQSMLSTAYRRIERNSKYIFVCEWIRENK